MRKIVVLICMLIGLNAYSQYSAPFLNSNESWKESKTKVERITSLQIPQDELVNIPTKTLLNICLEYPYLIDIIAYSDFQRGFEKMISDYNGFRELFGRQDYIDCVFEKLSELPNRTKEILRESKTKQGGYSLQYLVLEYMMAQDIFIKNLNNQQKDTLGKLLMINNDIMLENPHIYGASLLRNSHDANMSAYVKDLLNLNNKSWTGHNVETPNGTNVIGKTLDTGVEADFSTAEHDSIYAFFMGEFSSLSMPSGGNSSKKYNCHGYAWHMYNGNTSDKVIIEDLCQPSTIPYVNDESYVQVSNLSDADIVVFSQYDHSAIKQSNGSYISKWGLGPLFEHSLADAIDYYGNVIAYYKRATPSVIGDTRPCSSTYRVYSLHNDANVSWSFSGGTSSSLIAQNSPSTNRCTISNSSHTYIKDNLVATVSRSGASTYTVSKALDTGINFSGSYTGVFTGMAPAGVTYPPISSTSISSGNTYPVTGGYTLTLTSSYFQNATVSYTGSAVNTWTNTGNGTITMKLNNVWTTSTVTITGYKGCDVYQIKFFVFANMTALGVPQLIVESDGQTCEVMMAFESEGKLVKASELNNSSELEWDLTIANVKTGKIVYDGHLVGPEVKLDTSDWEPGIYAFRAKIGDEVVTQKVTIGKNK